MFEETIKVTYFDLLPKWERTDTRCDRLWRDLQKWDSSYLKLDAVNKDDVEIGIMFKYL